MDFAKRVHDHQYRFDPIIRSLLDTDFYKLLMLQFIWKYYPDVQVTIALKNRTKSVRLIEEVDEDELRQQLDYVKSLRFETNQLIWLAGNTFYGTKRIFEPEFIEFLRSFKLSDYFIDQDTATGQWTAEFSSTWLQATLWEIYILPIVNELRNRHLMADMTELELDIMYSAAKTKLFKKLERLNRLPTLNVIDFGTRRRHSFLWQEWVVKACRSVLGDKFTGTSNAYLAYKLGIEAKGTNAHELPMVVATLAQTDEELRQSQYKVLAQWMEMYPPALWVALPDTYGTRQFLEGAPDWFKNWNGIRIDSMDPVEAIQLNDGYWKRRGVPHLLKLNLPSDGLDVDDIVNLQEQFMDHRMGYGWGTMLTNDFLGCHPREPDRMKPISLVCKVKEANGRPAVKLSDNLEKATGTLEEIARYKRAFGYTEDYAKEAKV